jgi:hypothetical protein
MNKIYFVSLCSDSSTFAFWFINYALNTYTNPTPGFTITHSNTVTSYFYEFDPINNFIILVFIENAGSTWNMKYKILTYVSDSNLTTLFSQTLLNNVTYSTSIKSVKLLENFLLVSCSNFTVTFKLDIILTGFANPWVQSFTSFTSYDILPLFPFSDTRVVLYFSLNDGTSDGSRLKSDTSCFFYSSIENGTAYCRTKCASTQITYNKSCITCPASTPFYTGSMCVAACTGNYLDTCSNLCVTSCSADCPFLDSGNKCVATCTSPNLYINPDNNSCSNTCPGSYPFIGTNSICINACPIGWSYYLDSSGNQICTQICPTNMKYQVDGTSQCLNGCPSGTKAYNYVCYLTCPLSTYTYNSICLDQCNSNTYTYETNKTCNDSCPSLTYIFTNFCVDICPSGTVVNGTACSSSCALGTYSYQSQCVSVCPTSPPSIVTDNTNRICYDCADGGSFKQGNTCVLQCSSNYVVDNLYKVCIDCKSQGQFLSDSACVGSCPLNTVSDALSGKCIDCSLTGEVSYQGLCVTKCPDGYIADSNTHICNQDQTSANAGNINSGGTSGNPSTDTNASQNNNNSSTGNSNSGNNSNTNISSGISQTNNNSNGSTDNNNNNNQNTNIVIRCNNNYCNDKGDCTIQNLLASCTCYQDNYGTNCQFQVGDISQVRSNVTDFLFNYPNSPITQGLLDNLKEFVILSQTVEGYNDPAIESNLVKFLSAVIPDNVNVMNPEEVKTYMGLLSLALENDITGTHKSTLKNELNELTKQYLNYDANDGIIGNQLISTSGFKIQIYNSSDMSNEDARNTARGLNLSLVNLTNCENVLKKEYNLGSNETLYYSKIDYIQNNTDAINVNATQVTSGVSYNIYNSKGKLLDLSYCKNTSIILEIPLLNTSDINYTLYNTLVSEGIDIYNPNSPFYNDRCFNFGDNGTDLTLNDRRHDIYQNMSGYCQTSQGNINDNCNYTALNQQYVVCQCLGNTTEVSGGFVNDFLNPLTSSNFMVILCIQKAFSIPQLYTNVGFFMFLCLLVLTIFFIFCGYFLNKRFIEKNLYHIIETDARMMNKAKVTFGDNPQTEEQIYTTTTKDNVTISNTELITLPSRVQGCRQMQRNELHTIISEGTYRESPNKTMRVEDYDDQLEIKLEDKKITTENIKNKLSERNMLNDRIITEEIHSRFNSSADDESIRKNTVETFKTPMSEVIQNPNPLSKDQTKSSFMKMQGKKQFQPRQKDSLSGLFHFDGREGKHVPNNDVAPNKIISDNKDILLGLKGGDNLNLHFSNNLLFQKKKTNSSLPLLDDNIQRKVTYNVYMSADREGTKEDVFNTRMTSKDNLPAAMSFVQYQDSLKDEKLKDIPHEYRHLLNSPTTKDFEEMNYDELVLHEKRGFWKYYWILVKDDHIVLSIWLKKSLLVPKFIRIALLFFNISLDYATNALFYSDEYISNRHQNSVISTNFLYTITNEMPKSIWSMLITAFLTALGKMFMFPNDRYEEEMNKNYRTFDKEKVREGYYEFLRKMKIRYVAFFISILMLHVLCWYYVTAFCACYPLSQIGWVLGGIVTSIITIVFIELFIPLLITINYFLAIKCGMKCLLKFNFLMNFIKLFNA